MLEIFDVEVIHNDKYMSAKIKVPCTLHSTILIDSFYRRDKSYYPQTLIEDCKYEVRKVL